MSSSSSLHIADQQIHEQSTVDYSVLEEEEEDISRLPSSELQTAFINFVEDATISHLVEDASFRDLRPASPSLSDGSGSSMSTDDLPKCARLDYNRDIDLN